MKKKLWYAVSGSGQGRIFTAKPERDEHFKIWLGESVGCISTTFMIFESEGMAVPNLKWTDDPVGLTLSIEFDGID